MPVQDRFADFAGTTAGYVATPRRGFTFESVRRPLEIGYRPVHGTWCVIATRSDPARGPRLAGRAPLGRPAAARPSATRLAPIRASRPRRAHRATPQSSGSAAPTRAGGRRRRAARPPVRRQPQAGSVPLGAGQAVVNVDAVITDAESGEAVALSGQILLFGGHPRVAHQELVHGPALADTFGPVKPRPAAPDPSPVRLWRDGLWREA